MSLAEPYPSALPGEAGLVPAVPPLDDEAMRQARTRLDRLVKPRGSLGKLEELAVRLAGIAGVAPPPVPDPKAVLVFAGDHGVVAQGVSAFPAWVTARMVRVFREGGAAISVLTRWLGARLWVVDVGVAGPTESVEQPGQPPLRADEGVGPPVFVAARVRAGTRDLTRESALTREEAAQALMEGRRLVREVAASGARLIGFGEMGIGNTTPASALVAALTGARPDQVVGPGTGLDAAGVARKREVVRRALDLHRPGPHDPLGALAAVGGLEVAALAGGLLEAASLRIPAVLDGFVVAAAALVAACLRPEARAYWLAGHRSAEPGHQVALTHLGLRPLLQLEMRLGEGSGAALAFPIVEAAARLSREMWTLEQAGVTGP